MLGTFPLWQSTRNIGEHSTSESATAHIRVSRYGSRVGSPDSEEPQTRSGFAVDHKLFSRGNHERSGWAGDLKSPVLSPSLAPSMT